MKRFTFTVDSNGQGSRLDHFLVTAMPDLTRARLQGVIKSGHVFLGGHPITQPSSKLTLDQRITVEIPELTDPIPQGQKVDFTIVYEDEDLLVINKPAGLVVHPGAGNPDKTLVNGLIEHCGDSLSGIGGVKRPGIVHRLDKGTSGLMVVAKNDFAHHALSAQFADRSLSRRYYAFCWGRVKQTTGTVEGGMGRDPRNRQRMKILNYGGKESKTNYRVIQYFENQVTWVECRLETGRTHQIRVHMQTLGHPLLGDNTYGKVPRAAAESLRRAVLEFSPTGERPALHAFEIKFKHPRTGKQKVYNCNLPADLQTFVDTLETLFIGVE